MGIRRSRRTVVGAVVVLLLLVLLLVRLSDSDEQASPSSGSLFSQKDPLHVFLRDGVQNQAMELNFWLR
jgi:hypothetical protein